MPRHLWAHVDFGDLATYRLALRRFNCTKELGALCLCPKPVRARPGTSSRQLSDLSHQTG